MIKEINNVGRCPHWFLYLFIDENEIPRKNDLVKLGPGNSSQIHKDFGKTGTVRQRVVGSSYPVLNKKKPMKTTTKKIQSFSIPRHQFMKQNVISHKKSPKITSLNSPKASKPPIKRRFVTYQIPLNDTMDKAELLIKHANDIVEAQERALSANMGFCVEFFNKERNDAAVMYFEDRYPEIPLKLSEKIHTMTFWANSNNPGLDAVLELFNPENYSYKGEKSKRTLTFKTKDISKSTTIGNNDKFNGANFTHVSQDSLQEMVTIPKTAKFENSEKFRGPTNAGKIPLELDDMVNQEVLVQPIVGNQIFVLVFVAFIIKIF